MRRLKGDAITVQKMIFTAAAIFGAMLIFIFLMTAWGLIFKPACWRDPYKKLTGLTDGDTTVDFEGCVEKVIFVNVKDLETVKDEVDIYGCDEDDQRLKGYGSFVIIIPIEYTASVKDFLQNPIKTIQKSRLKPACVWKSHNVYQKVVFEGSDKEHCIHKGDTYPPIKNVKIIAEC